MRLMTKDQGPMTKNQSTLKRELPTAKRERRTAKGEGVGGLGVLRIERIELRRIKPAAYNPRVALKPGDPAWERLVASVESFGYVDPLIWNQTTGNLVGGHQRYAVLKHKGVKRADVSVVALDLKQEKLLNLALNKVQGRWDQESLAALLGELAGDQSVALALSGFTETEVERIVEEGDALVEQLVPREEEAEAKPEKGKEVPEAFQVVVECTGEAQQQEVYEKMTQAGYKCRVLTM